MLSRHEADCTLQVIGVGCWKDAREYALHEKGRSNRKEYLGKRCFVLCFEYEIDKCCQSLSIGGKIFPIELSATGQENNKRKHALGQEIC